ncbi:hypothetical protein Tco_0588496 [Tanacetum coccineum]
MLELQDLSDSFELEVWFFVDVKMQEFPFCFPKQCHFSRNSSSDQYDIESSPEVTSLSQTSCVSNFFSSASLIVCDTSSIMSCDTCFVGVSSSSEAYDSV